MKDLIAKLDALLGEGTRSDEAALNYAKALVAAWPEIRAALVRLEGYENTQLSKPE